MSSVTNRIKEIHQPTGGYIPINTFEKNELSDNLILEEENIHASLIGLVVDYMSRFLTGTTVEKSFEISLMGAAKINELDKARKLLENIHGNDSYSIINACKLVGYDVCYRAGQEYFKNVDLIEPDEKTIKNIKIMINRSLLFFKIYGPKTMDGITFERGYTSTITAGDADFLTSDTLWDFKVSKSEIKKEHTLQLIIYYLMGLNSIHRDKFLNIKKIGIFNPRLNIVYEKNICDIPKEVIQEISDIVIGYNSSSATHTNCSKQLDNEIYTTTDIMHFMGCSRNKVMNYYTQYDLPLYKKNNRYYIKKTDFEEWLLYMEELEEQEKMERIILTIVSLIISIIPIIYVFYKLF